jgi:PKD repeat protein
MRKNLFFNFMITTLFLVGLNSCEKETPAPTVDFTFQANGLTVTFTSTVTDVSTYTWDFGDSKTSTEANPVYTYAGGGEFEVMLTVVGEGGTAAKKQKVTVSPSLDDVKKMISGGPSAPNGKTWVLKTSAITEGDGASAVEPNMLVLIPVPADFYGWLGREKDDGTKDEFTFKYDGTYSVNTKNDTTVAISLFAYINNITVPNTNSPYGTCRAKYKGPTGATWTLTEGNITVDAITNPSETKVPPVHANVTFTNKKYLSFSTGSYFGFLDFTTSKNVIIKSVSPTELRVAMMVCMYAGAADPSGLGLPFANYPTHMYHMTFIAK